MLQWRFIFVICFLSLCSWEAVADDVEQCKPQQVHLSYGDTSEEVVIMWSTLAQCSTMVKYGTQPFGLDGTTPGETRVFDDEDSNEDGIKYFSRVKLRGLAPDTVYYYQPVSNGISVGPYFFRTPPVPPTNRGVQLISFAGLNSTSPVILPLVQEIQSGKYLAILHAGDIAMNLDSDGGQNADKYMTLLEPALKSVPYMTCPGDAEAEGGTYSQYMHRFSMPQVGWPMSLDKLWYSVNIGIVHLISLSTDVFFTNDGKYASLQRNWLIKDLKTANSKRKEVPWVVAFSHQPLYCSYTDPDLSCNDKKSKIRKGLEDIMYYYGVDIMLSSYDGAYERSHPMYKGVQVTDNYTNPMGPVYINLGATSPWELLHNFTDQEDWLAHRNADPNVYSFGRLNIINASLAEFHQVELPSLKNLDTISITQENHGPFSTEKLPDDVHNQINDEIIKSGDKPGNTNINETPTGDTPTDMTTKIKEFLNGDNKNNVIIGVSIFSGIVVLLVVGLVVRRIATRRRRRASRRWETMDINYGKRYYSKAPDKDDMDNDFEIDISESTEPNKKLLTDD